MERVYYKGQPYEFSVAELSGKRKYSLYKQGTLIHFVDENELDKKSMVSMILDAYFRRPR